MTKTKDELLALLRARIALVGTQREWAKRNRVSAAYLNDVLNGYKEPGFAILDPLGYERIVSYKKVRNGRSAASR